MLFSDGFERKMRELCEEELTSESDKAVIVWPFMEIGESVSAR